MRTMRLLVVAAVLCGALLAAGTASAAVKAGDAELSLFGALISTEPDEGESTTTLLAQVTGGVFLTDNGQVGGSFTTTSFFNSFDVTIQIVQGFYKHHFTPEEEVVPYVGGQGGLSLVEIDGIDSSAFSYGGMAGVKFFVSEDLSVNGEFNVLFTTIEIGGVEQDVTQTTLQTGLSLYF